MWKELICNMKIYTCTAKVLPNVERNGKMLPIENKKNQNSYLM